MYFCSTASASWPDCIASRAPWSWAVRWFPGAGHNIREPAAFGKIPIYGPSMENFREMSGKFLTAGAAMQVKSSEELGAAWTGLLRDPERADRMGTCAREMVTRNRGATQ